MVTLPSSLSGSRRPAAVILLTGLLPVLLAGLLYVADLGRLPDIPGAVRIETAILCDAPTCIGGDPVALPWTPPLRWDATNSTRHLRLTLPAGAVAGMEGVSAIYLPKVGDRVAVRANGVLLRDGPTRRLDWTRPLLVSLPPSVVEDTKLILDLTVTGRPANGINLFPVYIGPQAVLAPHYALRTFLSVGLARFTLGLMVVLASTLLLVWAVRRQDREYLWLGLACAVSCVTLLRYGFGWEPAAYRAWTAAWILAPALYTLFVLKFLRDLNNEPPHWIERPAMVALAAVVALILAAPADLSFALALAGTVLITTPMATISFLNFLARQPRFGRLDFALLLACFSLAISLGLFETALLASNTAELSLHLFHLMPLVMAPACIWLILSRLLQSLRDHESLLTSMSGIIAKKSADLEDSFASLAESQKREAIALERERIMLDLHDGIGGQLVSLLAYMRNNNVRDARLQSGLEDAVRDLALMLDTMENDDSLVTLLGMLRERLEGLLSDHGITFDWQIHGEPELSVRGPSSNLHLVRIVQEAITNVIKHGRAATIEIYLDDTKIRIADDGVGFDATADPATRGPSHGIAGMRRRSELIGAAFEIKSDPRGTEVILHLNG